MNYNIIPLDLYFTPGATNYLTPGGLNQIFNNINTNAMSVGKFLRPPQFVASANVITCTTDPTISVSPNSITIQEVSGTNDFFPDGWSISHEWTSVTLNGFTSGDLTANTLTLTHDDETQPTTHSITCEVTITYTPDEGDSFDITAIVGLPIAYLADGEHAITTPQPLIDITSTHQPLTSPGGSAVFTARDISFMPPGVSVGGGAARTWTLEHAGTFVNSFLTNTETGEVTITIPEVGKDYTLTLTINPDEGNSVSSSVSLHTYDYGAFFYSAWNSETPVHPPTAVTLDSAVTTTSQTDSSLFPLNRGALEAKWGKNIDDLQLKDANDAGLNYVFCVSGLNYPSDVEAVMVEYGLSLSEENSNEYSLVNLYDNAQNLVGSSFWTANMNAAAPILHKVQDISILGLSGYIELGTNVVYLVKGIVPDGQQIVATSGPGAERYYVNLRHYSLSEETGTYVYNGKEDRQITITQSGNAAPILASFNDIPRDTYFKAEVISSNGSAYAPGVLSNAAQVVTIAPASITGIIDSSHQYGLQLEVTWEAGSGGGSPIGFLAVYKELDPAESWPEGVHLYPTQTEEAGLTTVYSNTKTLRIPAKLNKTVVTSVRAVMQDGSMSDPVTTEPISVDMPTSLELRDFSQNLGRFKDDFATQNIYEETLILNNVDSDDPGTWVSLLFSTYGPQAGNPVFSKLINVYYDNALLVPETDYSQNSLTGDLTFITSQGTGSENVKVVYKYVDPAEHLLDTSLVDAITPQRNIFYTMLARSCHLEAVYIWVHSLGKNDAQLSIQTDQIDETDEKTKKLVYAEVQSTPHKLYYIPDLSLPLSAGETLIVTLQQDENNDMFTEADISVVLHYSPVEITSNTPGSGDQLG